MKKIVLGAAVVLAGLGMNTQVVKGGSVGMNNVVAVDTADVKVRMNLGQEQVQKVLQGFQLPEELMSKVTAPGVENVNIAMNASDVRYLLQALGLDENILQIDAAAGTAKLGMTQAAMPQFMGLLKSFPGLMTMQLDPTTRQLQMKINSEVIQNTLKGIALKPELFNVVTDATGKSVSVDVASENVRALADGLKAVIAKNTAANGGASGSFDLASLLGGSGAKINLTQNIHDPITVSSTTDKLKVQGFTLNNDYCIVILDATACKGKLTGIDKTAYFEVDGVKYPIKEVKEAAIPADSKTAMTWDSGTTTLNLVFPGIKVNANSKMVLVLSTAENGVRIETKFRTNG